MKKFIEVKSAETADKEMVLTADQSNDVDVSQLTAKGQVLADSDQLAFIYILESDEEFIYVRIPSHVWGALQDARTNEIPVVLNVGEHVITLEDLHEELDYLVQNIEGNSNYGEDMVGKVEEIFITKS